MKMQILAVCAMGAVLASCAGGGLGGLGGGIVSPNPPSGSAGGGVSKNPPNNVQNDTKNQILKQSQGLQQQQSIKPGLVKQQGGLKLAP